MTVHIRGKVYRMNASVARVLAAACVAAGALVAAALMWFIVRAIGTRPLAMTRPAMDTDLTRTIGESVLTTYVLPFELLGVLMLAAMLGAMYFARPED